VDAQALDVIASTEEVAYNAETSNPTQCRGSEKLNTRNGIELGQRRRKAIASL